MKLFNISFKVMISLGTGRSSSCLRDCLRPFPWVSGVREVGGWLASRLAGRQSGVWLQIPGSWFLVYGVSPIRGLAADPSFVFFGVSKALGSGRCFFVCPESGVWL